VIDVGTIKGLLGDDASPSERDGYARDKDAGSVNSSAIGATEDAVLRRLARSEGRGFVSQKPIQWGYAINQWRNLEVDLVRKDQMESAFKVISVCGFNGIEITDTAIGTHGYIPGLFGSVRNFMNFLNDCGVERVCSLFFGYYRGSPLNPADHGKLADEAGRIAEFIAQLGASCFVARPMGRYFKEAPITDDKIKTVGECWSKVGEVARCAGVETAMHCDFLCGIRNESDIEKLLQWSDPQSVGFALDTAELTIAGIDAVKFYEKHHDRINHVHFKDATTTDTLDEYKDLNAEIEYWPMHLCAAGAKRGIERWYFEMGTPGGLVDFPALKQALTTHAYDGWVVVESDQSPHVEESVMLNGWYLKQVLTGRKHG
jgi:inosose dehydratase